MKPYGVAIYNLLRFTIKKWCRCRNLEYSIIELISPHMKLKFQKTSKIHFGSNLVSDGHGSIVVDAKGKLYIGDKVYFNENFMLSCKQKVEIGEGCQFGPSVKIFDNDHKFDAKNGVSVEHTTDEIKIGKACWIASNVVILKGTEIGDNCVIGAGCIVQGKIPSASIITQERRMVIRPIEENK